eukprot:SAG31_NODE_4909_length_2872_cov_8.516408_1_plen_268_part_00
MTTAAAKVIAAPALFRKRAASAAAALLLLLFFMVHRVPPSANCTIDCRIGRAIWGDAATNAMLCDPSTCPIVVPRLGHCAAGCKGAGRECMGTYSGNTGHMLNVLNILIFHVIVGLNFVPTLPVGSAMAVLEQSTWTALDVAPVNRLNTAIDENIQRQGLMGEGSTAQNLLQRRVYTALASLPCVQTICEVGFNYGHSAGLWLLANPTADVYFFDLFQWTGAVQGEKFLRQHGQEHGIKNVSRLMPITKGDSGTVPARSRAAEKHKR